MNDKNFHFNFLVHDFRSKIKHCLCAAGWQNLTSQKDYQLHIYCYAIVNTYLLKPEIPFPLQHLLEQSLDDR